MCIPIQNTYVYSLSFFDEQILLAKDHDDVEYIARKLKEEHEKCELAINLEKTKYVFMGEGKEILRNKTMYIMYLFRYKNRPFER
jgi:hypothetical protein